MKRKQISALLLSSTLIVSNVTPTLAATVQGPVATMSTQESVTESLMETPDTESVEGLQEHLEETPTDSEDISEPEIKPEVVPDVEEEAAPETTPETVPDEEVTPETTPEVEAPAVSEVPKAEKNTDSSNNEKVESVVDTAADTTEETTKPAVGTQFELELDNKKVTCEVTGENTVDILMLDSIMYEDHSTIIVPSTLTYENHEYSVINVQNIGVLETEHLIFEEGIEGVFYDDFWRGYSKSVTFPVSLKKLALTSTLVDGTKYAAFGKVEVILPESNPYFYYDANKQGIFSKIEETGPELNVGDTFKKGIFKYEVVEPGVVDMIDFLTMNDTVGEIPGTLTYKGHEYKVRDCYVGDYKHNCRNMTRFSFGEGIRNIYWGEDSIVGSLVKIEQLEYPSTLESFDYVPELPALQSITIPESNPHYAAVDGILYSKDMTELVHMPSAKPMDVYTPPASVTTIKPMAFMFNNGIKELIIPDTVKVIESTAIIFTEGIEKITIESGVEKIGSNLYGCDKLKTAVIKMRVSYPQSFLSNCPDLEEVYLDGPENLGFGALEGLPSLKAYHVTNSSWLSSVDGILCSKNEEVLMRYPANKDGAMYVVPDKVEIITSQAFLNTKNLETLVLPKGVELYGSVVEDPVKPLDVYIRDTESIKQHTEKEPLFVSQAGGNVYVPNQTVLDNVKNGNMTDGMEASVKVIPVKSITLDQGSIQPVKGSTTQIKASVEPYYATEQIEWHSEDESVATVDQNGNITAHKAGKTRIVASVAAQARAIAVDVKVPLESIQLNKESLNLSEGASEILEVTFNPEDTTDDKTVTWTSSDKAVASVDANGKVTAHKAGTATITAKVGDKTATCTVTVGKEEIGLDSITLDHKKLNLKINGSETLKVSYNPSNTTVDKTVAWSSSNEEVASVDANGKVTAHKAGTATITAKVGDKTATCTVTVGKEEIGLDSITLDHKKLNLKINGSETLKVFYNPSNTTVDKTVAWSSSNEEVASVDSNGKVTAHKAGTATITAKVGDKTATCTVTVEKSSFGDAEISLSNDSFTYDGKEKKPSVTVKIGGKEISDYSVSYSNNVNAGTAKVTVTATGDYHGTKELTFTIHKANVQDASVSGLSDKTFNGKGQTQDVSVKVNGRTLSGSDYSVSYSNNVQPGTATMTIKGKGNYTGSKNFTFKVKMKAGWTQVGSTWYYGNSNGTMVKDGWVDGYYMDKNGVWVPGVQPPQWIKSGNRWWYRHMDGSYTRSNWEQINGKWYYFDASGWMLTGWQFVNGRWYYMDASGAMQTGWQRINNTWYYLNSSGAMLTGWAYVGNKWYYMNGSGAMQTGWQHINGRWYYLDASGAMQTGWKLLNGKWYYMNTSGAMQTGWQHIDGKWYYLNDSGAMLTGWQKINGKWYYMYSNGAMAENTWVGKYFVNSSGAWIKTR